MRICAGRYKGRKLQQVPAESTRETSDKVKQAVFNMIFHVADTVFLDVFAGSGQMALEAISRGASHAYVVESNTLAMSIILDNAMQLGCQKNITLIERDAIAVKSSDFQHEIDIIYMDPPYAYEIKEALFKKLPIAKMCFIETHRDTILETHYGPYQFVKEKKYGIKKISYYTISDVSH